MGSDGGINNVGLPPAHAVDTIMTTALSSGTSLSAGSGMWGSVSVIHDQVIGTPRISIWQDRQRELAQAASPSSSEETDGTAEAGPTAIRTQVT
jgi:hypothetical protein